jgi:hypothetical protein
LSYSTFLALNVLLVHYYIFYCHYSISVINFYLKKHIKTPMVWWKKQLSWDYRFRKIVYSLLSGHPRFPKLCPFNRGVRSRGIFFLTCNTICMCIIICLWSVTMIKMKQKMLVMQLLSPLIWFQGPNKEIFLFLALTKFCVTYSWEFHFCKNSPFCL